MYTNIPFNLIQYSSVNKSDYSSTVCTGLLHHAIHAILLTFNSFTHLFLKNKIDKVIYVTMHL